MAQKVVIVESPAKAKTINKYLGKDYTVVASIGHIRDLPPRDGSVRPDEDFAMDWELGERAPRAVKEISKAAKGAEVIYLATDPDREGEAIAWHVQEVLREKKIINGTPLYRVTFNEITKQAVLDSIAHPRKIDQALVDSYMARRALDYLVGFSLSPVLWRKLPGARSAGRVQSVALRLICEREAEIEKFKAQEFWTIEGLFKTTSGAIVPARLTHFDGKKLDKFALQTKAEATAMLAALEQLSYQVATIEKKQVKRNPYPPFITSTLQQEASRKLGFSATRTMRIAQALYEGEEIGGETTGLITYMRTDSVSLSNEAIQGAREVIVSDFGKDYLPSSPRTYKSKAKNAQEAHEAIRPTDIRRRPDQVAKYIDGDALQLYTLIWQRTMASQMASAVIDQVSVNISGGSNKCVFRATGSTIAFDGFLRVYEEDYDDAPENGNSSETRLPPLKEKEVLEKQELKPEQHFTQPPPRYSEASLVKKLEELGIGRPSTYAGIMQVLQDRDYVRLEKKRFVPEDRGRVVTAFLENFFGHYIEYDFTADLEERLDDISNGRLDWKKVMRDFWTAFSKAVDKTKELRISDVIDALDKALGPHFFPEQPDGSDPRKCNACGDGRLGLKLGKFGAFIGCSNYPKCKNTKPLVIAGAENGNGDTKYMPPRALGNDPKTGLPVTVRTGPYGAYIQLGPAPEVENEGKEKEKGKRKEKKKSEKKKASLKPKRVPLPKGVDLNSIDLTTALQFLALPRDLGKHPKTGQNIYAGIGRYGPFIKMGTLYKNLAGNEDILTISIDKALTLLAENNSSERKRFGASSGKLLGEHPDDGKPVTLNKGRFGPYVKWGKTMATVTSAYDPETLNLAQAVEILAAKALRNKKPKK